MIITHGAPGSGKSTIANKLVEKDPMNAIRANRDDLREIIAPEGAEYHNGNPRPKVEKEVSNLQHEIIEKGLREGKTVIVDDTNLNPKRVVPLVKLAQKHNAEIEQIHVDVPIEECKRRNHARGDAGGRRVPDFVIDSMAKNAYGEDGHLKNFVIGKDGQVFAISQTDDGTKKIDQFNKELSHINPMKGNSVVVLDADGTLFNNAHDSEKYLGKKKSNDNDFESFFKAIRKAPVNHNVLNLANRMRDDDNLNIVVITGRTDDYAKELIDALKKSKVKVSKLFMKRKGDGRPSNEHKSSVIKKLQKEGMVIVHAIDDRKKDIDEFEKMGILVTKIDNSTNRNKGDDGIYEVSEINTIYGTGQCIRCGSPLKSGGNIGPECRKKV